MEFIDRVLSRFGYVKLNKESIPDGVIEKEFGAYPLASGEMKEHIRLWYAMYINCPPWETCRVRPLGLPGAVGRELSRHALSEFSVAVSGSARAAYLDKQIQTSVSRFGNDLELGLCLGGVALKPYLERGRLLVDAFTTDFKPTRFDGLGRAIGGVFKSKPVRVGRDWYVRLEYHDFLPGEGDGGGVYVVENRAFRSSQEGSIGTQVTLDTVSEWAGLSEREEIGGLEGPLFAWFKPPMANRVDPSSPLGVSVYAGEVADLIRQADEQWERIRWEFESGERKIFSDASRIDDFGQFTDRLFIKGAFTSDGNLFEQFSPEFRNSSLYEGFQYTLKLIEFSVGLAFGTISDPQSVNKTATEEIMTKHRQYVTEAGIQKAFQAALDDLIYAMDALCSLYGLAPAGGYTADYKWGDGILDDPETRRQDMSMDAILVDKQLMSRKQFIMKWQKIDEKAAKKILAEIDDMDELVTEPDEEIE